jgi:putative ATPase
LQVVPEVVQALAHAADGDARRALNLLEVAAGLVPEGAGVLDEATVREALGTRQLRHDKAAEDHHNVTSAFIKSMRASDPDAAVYWLVRLLEAGDDPMFVARRLVIFAAEDVGNADPQGLVVANAAAQAAHLVGLPEARLPLTQATVYLALTSKSNAALTAYERAHADVEAHGTLEVPDVIRNAVTGLMRAEGYGDGYVYPHDCPEGVAPGPPTGLPEALRGRCYVALSPRGWEARAWATLQERRKRARGDD